MHVRRRRGALLVIIVTLIGAFLAGCGDDDETGADSGSDAPSMAVGSEAGRSEDAETGDPLTPKPLAEPRTLKVAARSWDEVFAALIVADALGEFEKENLSMEFHSLPSSEIQVLLATGQMDVGALGIQAGFMNAVAGGSGMRLVAPNFTPNPESKSGLWVTDDFAGDSTDTAEIVSRLKGKEIGTSVGPGTAISMSIDDALRKGGLSIGDVTLKQTGGGAEVLIALENNAVPAAWVLDPFWVELEDAGTAQFIAPQTHGVSLGGYIVGERLIEEEPETVQAFVRAMMRTVRTYLQGDYHEDDAVIDALVAASDKTAEEIRAGLPAVFDPDMALLDEEGMTRLQEIYLVDGILEYDEPLPYEQLVDTRFVDALTE